MADSRQRKSKWLKETSTQSGFDNFRYDGTTWHKRWVGAKQTGSKLTVAPDEIDIPPPSSISLGGAGISGSPRENSDFTAANANIPSELITVQYLTPITQISIYNQPWIQISGSNQSIEYPVGISFDSGNLVASTTTGARVFPHLVSGNNSILIVGVTSEDSSAGDKEHSVTYGGTNLTNAISAIRGNNRADIWYVMTPTLGANNVVVTWTGNVTSSIVFSSSYNNVNQNAQPNVVNAKSTGIVSSIGTSLTTTTDNCLIIDCLNTSFFGSFVTRSDNQVVRYNTGQTVSGHDLASSERIVGLAGEYSMGWSNINSGASNNVLILAAFHETKPLYPIPVSKAEKKIAIQCVGSGVTFHSGVGLALANSQSFSMNSGSILNLIFNGTDNLWHETSRVQNGGI